MILLHVNLCLGFWAVSKSALFMKMETACTLAMQSHLLQIVLTYEYACVCAHMCADEYIPLEVTLKLAPLSHWGTCPGTEGESQSQISMVFVFLRFLRISEMVFYFIIFLMLILERERERTQVREGQREGDRGSRVVSALMTESLMQGSNSPTSRS